MAKIIKVLNEQNAMLQELNQRKKNIKMNLNSVYEAQDTLDISALANYKNYLAKVDNDIKNQNIAIEHTKKVLKQKQLEVSDAHKEVKVMETLKEKQETEFYALFAYFIHKKVLLILRKVFLCQGADHEHHPGKIYLAVQITLEGILAAHTGGNRFLVRNLGVTHICGNSEFPAKPVHDYIQVQFTHTGY